MIKMNKLERLERTLQELREDPHPKLVEGKNDRKNLEALNIQNVRLIQNSSLQRTVETTKEDEVIILTDFDRRGEMILKRLKELFKNEGIETNTKYRKEIRRLTGIRTFEELVPRYHDIKNEVERKWEKHT